MLTTHIKKQVNIWGFLSFANFYLILVMQIFMNFLDFVNFYGFLSFAFFYFISCKVMKAVKIEFDTS